MISRKDIMAFLHWLRNDWIAMYPQERRGAIKGFVAIATKSNPAFNLLKFMDNVYSIEVESGTLTFDLQFRDDLIRLHDKLK